MDDRALTAQAEVAREATAERLCPTINHTRLAVLRAVLVESERGGIYAAQVARELKLDKGHVTKILQAFERDGIIHTNKRNRSCLICNGKGEVRAEGDMKKCLMCSGSGVVVEKSYPLFYVVVPAQAANVKKLIYSLVDLYAAGSK